MTNAVTTTVHKDLQMQVKNPAIAKRFEEVLGKRAPQFISSLIQVGNSLGPDCDSLSIISGAMVAASLDLPINKNLGFAWLVPFKEQGVKKAQFQMGFKGYIQLALRTGQYKRMNAGPMNKECVGGFDMVGERKLDFTQLDPDKPTAGYFFAFEMVNGFTKIAYWSKADVESHAKQYSQSYRGGYNSPWKTHFDEMATKTVIANELRRWGILSVEMQQALSMDQGIIRGMEGESVVFPDAQTEAPVVEVSASPANPTTPVTQQESAPNTSDDGDLGPQPESERKRVDPKSHEPKPPTKPADKTKAPEPAKPAEPPIDVMAIGPDQAKIESICKSIGVTFDKFQKFGTGSGVFEEAGSVASFAELPADRCKALTRSPGVCNSLRKGMADYLSIELEA